jgi:hypothetical protein
LKIDPDSGPVASPPLAAALSPGIFPYLGGSARPDLLRSVVTACGGAIVSGKRGAKLAAATPGVLVDPAAYAPQPPNDPDALFDYDDWLMRQRAAGVPLILTDTPRIPNQDRSALQKALARWAGIGEPVLVVLPVEPWWLRDGLPWLTEEVKAAGRPVAIVLLDQYNGLDAAGAVAGLLAFVSAVRPLPVVLLRCDISAVGAVAHGAFAGFVGWSAHTRHGPLPMRQPGRAEDRQDSPSVFVPALHEYVKAASLPAFARHRRPDVLRCHDPVCCDDSLLTITELGETDLRAGRMLAGSHNVAVTEQIARRILSAAEPREAWREACRAGAQVSASLAGSGISLPLKSWLRQWLETDAPSRDRAAAGRASAGRPSPPAAMTSRPRSG